MVTIFTIPKPFKNPHISLIQRNAIKSWKELHEKVEVFLCGEDYCVKETADEFHVRYIPNIKRNKFNTPLLNSAFDEVKKQSSYPILCYINCDIILLSSFLQLLSYTPLFDNFLMIGRRIDLHMTSTIVKDNDWENKIQEKIKKEGKLHGPSGIDYFVFPKHLPIEMKPFPVGRPGWDNWFIFEARKKKIPVIDVTGLVTVVHQNHDYSHHHKGEKGILYGKEAQQNSKLTNYSNSLMNILGANLILTPHGFKHPEVKRMLYGWAILFYPTRKLLSLKRRMQNLFFKHI